MRESENMATDMCSETSPRISFSHDLCQKDIAPVEHYKSLSDSALLDSNSDFVFCVTDSIEQESSSADELFSNGIILPIQLRERSLSTAQLNHKHEAPSRAPLPPLPTPSSCDENSKKESIREIMATSLDTEEKPPSKSFWLFKRSSSLNCDTGSKRSLICSLPLLSRSNSTGSVPNHKRAGLSKDKHNSQKQASVTMPRSTPSGGTYPFSQKPPLKKSYGGSYGQGISPVLNVPTPHISRGTANLLGFGSLFRDGKDKKMNKK